MRLIKYFYFIVPLHALSMSTLDITLAQLTTTLENLHNTIQTKSFEPQFDLLPLIQNKSYNEVDSNLTRQKIIIKQDLSTSLYQLWVTPQAQQECVVRAIENTILLINTITEPKENWEKNIAKLASKDLITQLCPVWKDVLQKIFPYEKYNPLQAMDIEEIPIIIKYFTTMPLSPSFPSTINTIAQHIITINYFVDFVERSLNNEQIKRFNQNFEKFTNDISHIQGINQLNEITTFAQLISNSLKQVEIVEEESFTAAKVLRVLQQYKNQSNSIFGVTMPTNGHRIALIITKYQNLNRTYYLDSMNIPFNIDAPYLKNWFALIAFKDYEKLIFPTWYHYLFYRYIYNDVPFSLLLKPDIGQSIITESGEVFQDAFIFFTNSLYDLEKLGAFILPDYKQWKPYVNALLKFAEEKADPAEIQTIEKLKTITQYNLDQETTAAYNYLLKAHKPPENS